MLDTATVNLGKNYGPVRIVNNYDAVKKVNSGTRVLLLGSYTPKVSREAPDENVEELDQTAPLVQKLQSIYRLARPMVRSSWKESCPTR